MSNVNYEREAAWHYLCSLKYIGIDTIEKLMYYAGDVMEIISLDMDEILDIGLRSKAAVEEWHNTERQRIEFREEYFKLKDKNYKFISKEHPDFPIGLINIPYPPNGLWYKGTLPNRKCAAIIGSRECTEYGIDVAKKIGKVLAGFGVGVISGMALGIDAVGQTSAIDNGGYSAGVLGCGVDICYPRHNINLYEKLSRVGCIISEFPPGTPGYKQNFRLRNRIISGLSECVIVIEAKIKSGTQVTVSWALDQGKDIFCIPGRITDNYSLGCNQMISQGATILNDFNTLKEYFNIDDEITNEKAKILSDKEKNIYNLIGYEAQHFESILIKSRMSTTELWRILFNLEQKKLIYQPLKNYYKLCL